MPVYKFKWKRFLFWNNQKVRGHSYDPNLDRMTLFMPDGGLMEIPTWSKCSARLGTDWLLAEKTNKEKIANQSIKLDVE